MTKTTVNQVFMKKIAVCENTFFEKVGL